MREWINTKDRQPTETDYPIENRVDSGEHWWRKFDPADKLEEQYGHVLLTPEEEKAAIIEGKIKKFFHDRNKEYWEQQEREAITNAKAH